MWRFFWIQCTKNYSNQLIFDWAFKKVKVVPFFGPPYSSDWIKAWLFWMKSTILLFVCMPMMCWCASNGAKYYFLSALTNAGYARTCGALAYKCCYIAICCTDDDRIGRVTLRSGSLKTCHSRLRERSRQTRSRRRVPLRESRRTFQCRSERNMARSAPVQTATSMEQFWARRINPATLWVVYGRDIQPLSGTLNFNRLCEGG